MAITSTKQKDSKYSHLQRVYSESKEQDILKTENKATSDSTQIKREVVNIPKKDIYKNIAIAVVLGALAVSGYLLTKI